MGKQRSPNNPTDRASGKSFLHMAFRWHVVKRALILSVVVGCLLVGINHGNCIVVGHFGALCLLQSLLTVLVPYAVSTVSSVLAMRDPK